MVVNLVVNEVSRCLNPLLTTNNPAPIPECRPKAVAHSAVVLSPLDLARLLTESPCVMTTEVLEIRPLVQSPAKVG